MELVKFIKENDNWRTKLSVAPYCVSIKDYTGAEEDLKGLTLFKYDQIKSDFNNPIVRECRGVVLEMDTLSVVCRAFDKFGNYGESYVPEIDWESAVVQEKLDGSLIKLWFYNGKWRVSTNGTINAYECDINDPKYNSFGELFDSVFDWGNFNIYQDFFAGSTIMFELCSPHNRVVVPHKQTKLYLIGARRGSSEKYVDTGLAVWLGVESPKTYRLNNLESSIEAAKELPWDDEGYVVVDNLFNRVKVKSPSYVAVHGLSLNGNPTVKRLYKLIKANETEEFLTYYPEIAEEFDKILKEIEMIKDEIKTEIKSLDHRCFADRKEFALYVKDFQWRSLMFTWLNGLLLGNAPSASVLFDSMKDTTVISILERRLK